MKLISMKIDNYKSFNNFEIEFNESKNVIIGKNNSGKTALLDLIKLMLNINIKGSGSPSFNHKFNDSDLYYDEDKPIKVEMLFKIPKNELKEAEKFVNRLSETKLYNESGKNLFFSLKFTKYINLDGEFEYNEEKNYNEYVKIHTYSHFNSLVFNTERTINVLKNSDNQEKSSTISFKKIFGRILIDFVSQNQGKSYMSVNDFFSDFNDWFFEDKTYTIFNNFFLEVSEIKFKNLDKLTKNDINKLQLNLTDIDHVNHIMDNIKIYVNDGKEQEISKKGSGLQNMFLILLIFKLNKFFYYPPIICIDEIELYLHPILQRNLNIQLDNLKNQFIVTSHSDKFISNTEPDKIFLLKKCSKTNITKKLIVSKEDSEVYRLFRKTIMENNSEFLFSDYVVLVEGDSDKIFFTHFSKIKKNYSNLSFVAMGSKYSVISFVKILNKFEIPYYIILDNDVEDGELVKIDEINNYKENVFKLKKGELENYYPDDFFSVIKGLEMKVEFSSDFKLELFINTIYNNREFLEFSDKNKFMKSVKKAFNSSISKEKGDQERNVKYSEILCKHMRMSKIELANYVVDCLDSYNKHLLFSQEIINIVDKIMEKPQEKDAITE